MASGALELSTLISEICTVGRKSTFVVVLERWLMLLIQIPRTLFELCPLSEHIS